MSLPLYDEQVGICMDIIHHVNTYPINRYNSFDRTSLPFLRSTAYHQIIDASNKLVDRPIPNGARHSHADFRLVS